MATTRFRMRAVPVVLSALALCVMSGASLAQSAGSGSAGGGAVGGGSVGAGAARSGPALAAPAAGTPAAGTQASPSASPTPSAAAPLPGQSTFPSQLPPLNANGLPAQNSNGVAGQNGQNPSAAGQAAAPAFVPGTIPTRNATAAQAFGALDSGQVGYVTRADVDRVPGFVGFDNADTNRDGQLTRDEFTSAWRSYSGQ